jgi:hypothetical protein
VYWDWRFDRRMALSERPVVRNWIDRNTVGHLNQNKHLHDRELSKGPICQNSLDCEYIDVIQA